MTITAVTYPVGGGVRTVINLLGQVGGVQFTSSLPGGDTSCQFTLAIPADANPAGLTTGSRLDLFDGPVRVWAGMLADAVRGTPWQVAGQGLSSLSDRYIALDASGVTTTDTTTAVTQAITRGLPWRNLIALSTASAASSTGSTVGNVLDVSSTGAGLFWGVDQNGELFQKAAPTTPSLLMVAANSLGGRTVDQFATDEYVRYTPPVNTSTGPVAGPPNVAAAPNNPASNAPRPFGRWERLDDLGNDGPITAASAQTYANGQLAINQPRATFSGSIALQPGDLLTLGGQPVRLSTIRAGQMVRVLGVQPDPALAELVFTLAVQIVIGQWTYSVDSDTGSLTALGAPARPTLAIPMRVSASTHTSAPKTGLLPPRTRPISHPKRSGPVLAPVHQTVHAPTKKRL